jgi:ribose 5-phosphate isomerase A
MAYVSVMKKIENLGGKSYLREGSGKAGPVITDNGNFILDADFGVIQDPVSLDQKLQMIPGIVETGLFCGMTQKVYIGSEDGTVILKPKMV